MRPDPRPVWILFRRRSFSRLAYWCLVLGYDFRDRSLNNRFYFVYFVLFWLVWIIAVFALLGYTLAGFFVTLSLASPAAAIVLLGAYALAVWGLVLFFQGSGRSPFVFSEPDAFLLCQAPVSRRSVGAAWFLMDWFGSLLPFAAAAVMFSFALTEAALPHVLTILDLLAYFAAALRALALVVPLQMGLQAALWGLGAWRLRRDRPPASRTWLRLVALLPGLALLASIFIPGIGNIILSPLTFFLQAAFSCFAFPLRLAYPGRVRPAGSGARHGLPVVLVRADAPGPRRRGDPPAVHDPPVEERLELRGGRGPPPPGSHEGHPSPQPVCPCGSDPGCWSGRTWSSRAAPCASARCCAGAGSSS